MDMWVFMWKVPKRGPPPQKGGHFYGLLEIYPLAGGNPFSGFPGDPPGLAAKTPKNPFFDPKFHGKCAEIWGFWPKMAKFAKKWAFLLILWGFFHVLARGCMWHFNATNRLISRFLLQVFSICCSFFFLEKSKTWRVSLVYIRYGGFLVVFLDFIQPNEGCENKE